MKQLVFLLLAVTVSGTAFAQLTTFFVMPNTVDAAYPTSDDSNYVALNSSVATNGKLLVFLPGTGAKTKHYQLFPNLAANLGYHCVSLAYPNGYPTVAMSCAGNADVDCYHDIRQEVCYGTPVSDNVTVDTLNSIYTRLVKLLYYLDNQYPAQGWGQFLTAGAPNWDAIAVSGHSQGGGHALYLAKTQSCERMIMFAGADDYSNYYSSAANWTFLAGDTPTQRFFSFLHLNDDVWDYAKQYTVVQATGMTAGGDDSTIVDNATTPYSNSHCLYTAVEPLYPGVYSAYHNGMVVDFYTPTDANGPIYTPVWTYMLTESVAGLNELATVENALELFPNPANETVSLRWKTVGQPVVVTLLDAFGQVKRMYPLNEQQEIAIPLSGIPAGVYVVRLETTDRIIALRKLVVTH